MNNNQMPIIIYEPSACEKFRNKENLALLFNRTNIVDNYSGEVLPPNSIAFTSIRHVGNCYISYDKAMQLYMEWISLCDSTFYTTGKEYRD